MSTPKDADRSARERTPTRGRDSARGRKPTGNSARGTAEGLARSAAGQAERAASSDTFRRLARMGHVANGVLHLVIGVIAWNLAFGGGGEADQSGAAQSLASNPWGLALLWVCVAGCALLALWHLTSALWGSSKTKDRLQQAGKTVVFAVVGVVFALAGLGGGQDSGETTQSFSAQLMTHPAGVVVLVVVGAAILAAGVYYLVKGLTRSFAKDLRSPRREEVSGALTVTGVVGHVAKGLVLVLLGLLFIISTLQGNPEENTGVDGALKALRDQPYGVYVLAGIGAGLMLFGIYLFLRSRYDRMED